MDWGWGGWWRYECPVGNFGFTILPTSPTLHFAAAVAVAFAPTRVVCAVCGISQLSWPLDFGGVEILTFRLSNLDTGERTVVPSYTREVLTARDTHEHVAHSGTQWDTLALMY